jgi:chromosome segregation ATPase
MKNFQQNLLIVLGVCLCGLCAYQWYNQTVQRKSVEKLSQTLYDKSVTIRDDSNSIATLNHQVAEMDSNLTALRDEARTNAGTIASQKRQLELQQYAIEQLTNEITQYQDAVGVLTNRLNEAYAGIEKQNAAIKDLIKQRDEFVQKYNDEVKDRNNIVSNYNFLAGEVKKMQSK